MKVDIGCNCYVDNKWIPKDMSTGLFDINGIEIKTSNKIRVNGCSSKIAIIGKTEKGFMIFFGSDIGSVGWNLDKATIEKHKIKVICD